MDLKRDIGRKPSTGTEWPVVHTVSRYSGAEADQHAGMGTTAQRSSMQVRDKDVVIFVPSRSMSLCSRVRGQLLVYVTVLWV